MKALTSILTVLFILSFAYRGVYFLVRLTGKKRWHPHVSPRRYAVLIAARNESRVIGLLLDSLKKQDYPAELLDVYVVADNCTDDTARTARMHGARVFERRDAQRVGKGWALRFLVSQIRSEQPIDHYAGYFIFDADNLAHPHYISAMNDAFADGCCAVLGYRTAKNFSDSWVSGDYGLYFICESECANRPRDLLGTSCMLSGTGCLLSSELLKNRGGWAWTGYTEDLECTADILIAGERIAYCPDAVLYDEQPRTLSESIVQRARWLRGYMEMLKTRGRGLLGRLFRRGGFAAFDFLMNFMPAVLLSAWVLTHIAYLIALLILRTGVLEQLQWMAVGAAWLYAGFFLVGFLPLLLEWKRIRASAARKLLCALMYPVFMASYLIAFAVALCTKPNWKPIRHDASVRIEDMMEENR